MTIYVALEKSPFCLHKGRLCQHSLLFEKAFYGSFKEAITSSLYLEEDGVEDFKCFEEWLYTGKLALPQNSDDASLLLVKIFCFAERVEIPNLQNLTLDALHHQASGQDLTESPTQTLNENERPYNSFTVALSCPTYKISAAAEKPSANYLPPTSSSAIHYTYRNTAEGSPLRKLLVDIFTYSVKPNTSKRKSFSRFQLTFWWMFFLVDIRRLPSKS